MAFLAIPFVSLLVAGLGTVNVRQIGELFLEVGVALVDNLALVRLLLVFVVDGKNVIHSSTNCINRKDDRVSE